MNYLNKKTVEDIDVKGKKVLVRCDFNVPLMQREISLTQSVLTKLLRQLSTLLTIRLRLSFVHTSVVQRANLI